MKKYCEEHGFTRAISALGLRADESKSRLEKALKVGTIYPKTKLITIWTPIMWFTLPDVFEEIKLAGQVVHWVYKKFSRLSCVMCVYGKVGEHKHVMKDRPAIFDKMAALEVELGKTIRMKQRDNVQYRKYLSEYREA